MEYLIAFGLLSIIVALVAGKFARVGMGSHE